MAQHQRIPALFLLVLYIAAAPSCIIAVTSSTFAVTSATEYTVTAMYTDFVIVNSTTAGPEAAQGCVFLGTYTADGDIYYVPEALCSPGEYMCKNGSFIEWKAMKCPAQTTLLYANLVITCASPVGCFIAVIIYSFCCSNTMYEDRKRVRDLQNLIKMERDASRTHWVHLNLIVSFLLRDVFTVVMITSDINKRFTGIRPVFTYIILCNFFWMFVEGLYLFISVTMAMRYRIDASPYLCTKIALFAWGVPAVLVSIWTGVEVKKANDRALITANNGTVDTTRIIFDTDQVPAFVCMHSWTFLMLVLNLLMLVKILILLRSKLQDTPSSLEQNSKHRRLAKATLFLVVLLGVPNIFPFLVNRIDKYIGPELGFAIDVVFVMMNAIQGLMVTILYVFCNKEVRRQIKRRWAYGNGWLCCRRDDRRRNARFGSVAQETNRTHVNNNSTSASSKGSVSVGISVGSMCSESGSEHKLLEEKQTLLLEGEKHLNGCKLNSNDSGSHGMNTIDETEQEVLLSLNKKATRIDIENNAPVTATYVTRNPETPL